MYTIIPVREYFSVPVVQWITNDHISLSLSNYSIEIESVFPPRPLHQVLSDAAMYEWFKTDHGSWHGDLH